MNRIVWLLVGTYVALGTTLFYGLAIGSPTVAFAAAAMLVVLAGPQRLFLSRRSGRPPGPGRVRSDRSSR